MGKVEDRLARERLEASLKGGSHISLGKLTTKTDTGEGKEKWEHIYLDLIPYNCLDGEGWIEVDKHAFSLAAWVGNQGNPGDKILSGRLEVEGMVGSVRILGELSSRLFYIQTGDGR